MSSSSTPAFNYDSELPYPPLHKDAKFVVLTDWDGTITDKDTNDYLTDNYGMGYEARYAILLSCGLPSGATASQLHTDLLSRALNNKVLTGEVSYRDSFHQMLESVTLPYEECKQILRDNIGLDPGFKEFYDYCRANDVPVVLVSSGMTPIIRAVLSAVLPSEADSIEIIANEVKFSDPSDPNSHWEIIYRHPHSHHGHDKSKAILPYRDLPGERVLFFCGDGVSDLSAAAHADVLFAKEMANGDSDLMKYCKREKIAHVPFTDFTDVTKRVKEVIEGKNFKDVLREAGNDV